MADAVVLGDVVKEFSEKGLTPVRAVDGLTLRVRRGEIFALVGPDGAGKTTTIRMMCGVLPPTAGTISVLGFDVRTQRTEIKRRIGYLSQRFSLYGDLSVDENVDFFAEIYRVPNARARKEELLNFTRLTPFRTRLADRLSGGMQQKLALVCTLIHAPEVIFLDEPTTGVDPVSRRDFWSILSTLLKSGITIIVSTPYLDEAERSARVALMNEGRLLACDTPEAIKESFGREVLEVDVDDRRKAVALLNESGGMFHAQLFGDRLHVALARREAGNALMRRLLEENGVHVFEIRPIPPTLEDVFVSRVTS